MRNGMLRRDFLRLASAAGASFVLPGCGDDGSGGGESEEIVVLGAGMAGLTAAFELARLATA
ncbi:MAG: twin-arginine translocation signal domain-containing protein [Deltaproteobacteria bacterium]|nr:twin-arginine translocation signal domain-containing protein [Deltaproteobacteria bacterium]